MLHDGLTPEESDEYEAASIVGGSHDLRTVRLEKFFSLKNIPSSIGELKQLRSLDLTGCASLASLAPISGLKNLERLNIEDCINIESLEAITGLSALTELDIRGCQAISSLEPLSGLSSLTQLNIGSCQAINSLEALTHLTALTRLDISWCDAISSLEPLAGLSALTKLYISGCAAISNLEPLVGLTSLSHLSIRGLKEVSSLEPLAGLINLKQLDLSECSGVLSVEPLRELRSLRELNLHDCSEISDLEALSDLKSLTKLDLAGCKHVVSLAPLTGLRSLKELAINSCDAIENLEPLVDLTSLKRLEALRLGTRKPLYFPKEIAQADREIWVFGSTFSNLSDELTKPHREENVGPALVAHFAEIDDQGQTELREIKMVLLGNGRAGKSSLVRALQGEPHQSGEKSTHGIRHWRWQPSVMLQGDEAQGPRQVDVNIWDFGGQQIYHELHRLFMGTRAVFILLWNPWEEQWKLDPGNPDHPVEFKDDEYHPLDYWLDQIHAYSRLRKPQIILVRNFMDKDAAYSKQYGPLAHKTWQDAVGERYRNAPNIQYVEFSAADRESALGRKRMGELRLALEYALNEQMRQLMSRYIPKGRYELRQYLAGLVKNGPVGEGDANSLRTMPYAEFDALVAQYCTVNGTHDTPKVLRFLHDIGALYYNERIPDKVVLDQRWAIEAFYILLAYGAPREEVMRAGGRFTRSQLVRWGWSQYTAAEQEVLLEMMVDCGVAVPIRSAERSARGEAEYLTPALMSTWQDPLVRTLAEAFPRGTDGLRATVQDARLGSEALMAVLAQVAERFGDEGAYWRHGFRLRTADGVHAHVEWSALEEHTYGGILTVEVAGGSANDQADLFRLLRQMFQRRSAVITEEAWVVEEVEGRGKVLSEPVSVQDLAWSQDQLQRIIPGIVYRERLSVGLSYAGQGDGPQLVAALSAELRPALSALGIVLVDYRRLESEAHDDTRRVINAVANSHLVLIFRDEHYLRSVNCLCELRGAYEAEPKGLFKRDRVKLVQLDAKRYLEPQELEHWANASDGWWLDIRNYLGGETARDRAVTQLALTKREYPWFSLADDRLALAEFNEFVRNHTAHVTRPATMDSAELERWAKSLTAEVVKVMKERWIGGDNPRAHS